MVAVSLKKLFFKQKTAYEILRPVTGVQTCALPISFTSVATDLVNQKEVWFQEGSLEQAIRASVAVPGVITPVQDRGRTLVDGGLLNPLPITPAVAWHADLIVAVNVTAQSPSLTLDELMPHWKKKHKKDTDPTAVGEWMHRIKGRAGDLLGRLNFWEGEENEPDRKSVV